MNPQLTFEMVFLFLVVVSWLVVMTVSIWRIFTKAGRPGWACLIPWYKWYVLVRIVGLPGWFVALPLLAISVFSYFNSGIKGNQAEVFGILVGVFCGAIVIPYLILLWRLAVVFGRSFGFFLGLLFFPFFCLPLLAFGDSEYQL